MRSRPSRWPACVRTASWPRRHCRWTARPSSPCSCPGGTAGPADPGGLRGDGAGSPRVDDRRPVPGRQSAGQSPSDLTSVLLVGGSSRIPLVAEMVSRELGRPTVADADPEYAMALGAASIAAASTPALRDRGGARWPAARGGRSRRSERGRGAPAPLVGLSRGGRRRSPARPPRPPARSVLAGGTRAPPAADGAIPGVGKAIAAERAPPRARRPAGHGRPVAPPHPSRCRSRRRSRWPCWSSPSSCAWPPAPRPRTGGTGPAAHRRPAAPAARAGRRTAGPAADSVAQPTVGRHVRCRDRSPGRNRVAGRRARLRRRLRHQNGLGGRSRDQRRRRGHPDRGGSALQHRPHPGREPRLRHRLRRRRPDR